VGGRDDQLGGPFTRLVVGEIRGRKSEPGVGQEPAAPTPLPQHVGAHQREDRHALAAVIRGDVDRGRKPGPLDQEPVIEALAPEAGHLRRVDSDDRRRGAMVLEVVDRVPDIRVNANELTIRAGRERRQLRELIRFCYAETCFRAYILDYFGDRNRAKTCGTCSNCDTSLISRDEGPGAQGAELRKKSPLARPEPRALSPEPLSADERNIRIRKILACAARMKGRFGKNMLAATLRGAKLAKLTEAQLDQLSTYGILRNMTQDEILGWIDALVSVQCLEVSGGRYPVVSITAHGREVMHERASVDLEVSPSAP